MLVAISYSHTVYLSGFYVNRRSIPIYWMWFHYISLLKPPYEVVLRINEFDDPSRCFVKEFKCLMVPLSERSDSGKRLSSFLNLGMSLRKRITSQHA
ncbi:unnamed protein product [Brassica napus]|nr:unnamed protein product [Brassica napus]